MSGRTKEAADPVWRVVDMPEVYLLPRKCWFRPARPSQPSEPARGGPRGLLVPVASRPDAAASKLAWASKGSHKSRRDLRHIVRHMPVAERAELDRLAAVLGLDALLAEILAEPDEIFG